jgi:two-component system sensor histidine kinase DegS
VTHVAIIGAGRGGTALMEIFTSDPLVKIIGIAETDPTAPGVRLAARLKIPVTRNFRKLLAMERVDLIIDVTGNPEVEEVVQDFYRMGLTVIGATSAKFMWQLIEARIRATAEIERALTKYQTLYRLYVKETAAAVTEERTRIACEMHDGLVQSLAGMNFKLDLCQELLRKDPKTCQTTLRETKHQLKLTIQEARQVIFNLRPVHYDKLELVPALTTYLQSYQTQYHIQTKFTVKGREVPMHQKTKIFLFRIVQEALSNVEKHAKAKHVTVDLSIGKQSMMAMIVDDGIGFDVETVYENPDKWDHFGLRGIVERSRLVGGDARIESKKGQGTRIRIEVPLLTKEAERDGTD